MNIDIKINRIPFLINELFDKDKLISGKVKKAGFLSKRMIKVDKTTILYWAKNCEISFFNDKVIIKPNLDTTSGASMMYGTSCYFFYNNDHLTRITAQIIKNSGASQYHAKKLKEIALNKIGIPEIQRRNEISDVEKIVKWTDSKIQFLYEFNDSYENVYFHLMLRTQT